MSYHSAQVESQFSQELPLSPPQRSLLMASVEGGNAAGYYIEQVVCRLPEAIDAARLLAAWERVFQRHPALGACLRLGDLMRPVFQSGTHAPVPASVQIREGLTPEEREQYLASFLEEDRARGFDLECGLLHRLTLFRFRQDQYVCVWTLHHVLCDGHGMALVVREALEEYDGPSSAHGQDQPLGGTALLFQQSIEHAPRQLQKTFWLSYLDGLEQTTTLPLEKPQRQTSGTVGAFKFSLSKQLLGQLDELAGAADVSRSTLFQAALGLLISRYTRSDDVLIRVTRSLRHLHPALRQSAGLFLTTLYMRVQIAPEMALRQWLQCVRRAYLAMREGELASPLDIAAWTAEHGIAAASDVYFLYERGTFHELVLRDGADWRGRSFQLHERTPLPLSVAVYAGSQPEIQFEYATERFSEKAIQRFAQHFHHLLEQFVLEPGKPLRQFEILTLEGRRSLLTEASESWCTGQPGTLPELLADSLLSRPAATAVEWNGVGLSYGELERRTNQLAHHLIAQGLRRNHPVGIMIPRSLEMVLGVVAIVKAGGAYLPIDANLPPERVKFMLQDAEVEILLTLEAHAGNDAGGLRCICLDRDRSAVSSCPVAPPMIELRPGDLAYIIYTSGSTGTPKGVAISHRAICTFVRSAIELYGFRPTDRLLQFASLSFDASAEEIFCTLTCGGCLVLRNEDMLSSAQRFLEQCKTWRITILDLTTAYWHLLADAVVETQLPPDVRLVLFGGEAMLAEKWRQWRDHVSSEVRVLNVYGPTEATIGATLWDARQGSGVTVSIGRPFSAVDALVLDHHLGLVPVGVPGELCLAGPQLAQGYLNRPELTERCFPPHPFRPGERMYRTGDLVRWGEDGQLYYLGRIDQQVKVRGFRIELGEIESLLLRHPKVRAATVVAGNDALGNQRIHAYVSVARHARAASATRELREWLASELPEYMLPSTLTVLPDMPVTATGKVDRKRLLTMASEQSGSARASEAPADELETTLARLWGEVLRVKHVGRQDNFFTLGGHSLLAFVMLTQVEKHFGKRIPPRAVYEAQTLAAFAAILRGKQIKSSLRSIHTIQKGQGLPTLYFVGSTDLLPGILPSLGGEWPVCSLNLFGLMPEEGPLPDVSVPVVAAAFIEELRKLQPKGPYCLGGYCRDAMVALEMAQQLTAAGEEVPFLLMLDVFWGAPAQYSWVVRHLRNLREFGLSYVADKFRGRRRWLHETLQRMRSNNAVRSTGGNARALPQEFRNAVFVNTFYSHCDAYRLTPYAGKITLILASEWGIKDVPELARLTRGGVELIELRAFHQNLWNEPQASELGKILRDCLERAIRPTHAPGK